MMRRVVGPFIVAHGVVTAMVAIGIGVVVAGAQQLRAAESDVVPR